MGNSQEWLAPPPQAAPGAFRAAALAGPYQSMTTLPELPLFMASKPLT